MCECSRAFDKIVKYFCHFWKCCNDFRHSKQSPNILVIVENVGKMSGIWNNLQIFLSLLKMLEWFQALETISKCSWHWCKCVGVVRHLIQSSNIFVIVESVGMMSGTWNHLQLFLSLLKMLEWCQALETISKYSFHWGKCLSVVRHLIPSSNILVIVENVGMMSGIWNNLQIFLSLV